MIKQLSNNKSPSMTQRSALKSSGGRRSASGKATKPRLPKLNLSELVEEISVQNNQRGHYR